MAVCRTIQRNRKKALDLAARWSSSGSHDGSPSGEGRGKKPKDSDATTHPASLSPSGRGRGRGAGTTKKEDGKGADGLMARVGALGVTPTNRTRRIPAEGRRGEGGRKPSVNREERFAPPNEAHEDPLEDVPWDAGRSSEQEARAARRRWTPRTNERDAYPREKTATSTPRRKEGSTGGTRRRNDAQAWYGDVNEDDRNRRPERRTSNRTARNRYDNVVTTRSVTIPETDFEQVDERTLRRYWFLKYHPSLQLNMDRKPPKFADPDEKVPTEEEMDRQLLERHEAELRELCQAGEDTVAWEKDKVKALANMRKAREKARARAVRKGESGYNDVMREERELHAIADQLPQDHPERYLVDVAVKTLCANPDWKFQQKKEFLVQMVGALQEEIDPKFNIFDF